MSFTVNGRSMHEREIDISIGKRKRNFACDEMDSNIQKVIDAIDNGEDLEAIEQEIIEKYKNKD